MSNRYCFRKDNAELHITLYTDRAFRITYGDVREESVIVTATPENVSCDYAEIDSSYIISTNNATAYIGKENLDISFFCGDKLISKVNAPTFEEYSIYRYAGGKSETRETVDGVKATAVDGEKIFVRNSSIRNACGTEKRYKNAR